MSTKSLNCMLNFTCKAYKLLIDEYSLLYRKKSTFPFNEDTFYLFSFFSFILYMLSNNIDLDEVLNSELFSDGGKASQDFEKIYLEFTSVHKTDYIKWICREWDYVFVLSIEESKFYKDIVSFKSEKFSEQIKGLLYSERN